MISEELIKEQNLYAFEDLIQLADSITSEFSSKFCDCMGLPLDDRRHHEDLCQQARKLADQADKTSEIIKGIEKEKEKNKEKASGLGCGTVLLDTVLILLYELLYIHAFSFLIFKINFDNRWSDIFKYPFEGVFFVIVIPLIFIIISYKHTVKKSKEYSKIDQEYDNRIKEENEALKRNEQIREKMGAEIQRIRDSQNSIIYKYPYKEKPGDGYRSAIVSPEYRRVFMRLVYSYYPQSAKDDACEYLFDINLYYLILNLSYHHKGYCSSIYSVNKLRYNYHEIQYETPKNRKRGPSLGELAMIEEEEDHRNRKEVSDSCITRLGEVYHSFPYDQFDYVLSVGPDGLLYLVSEINNRIGIVGEKMNGYYIKGDDGRTYQIQ